MHGEKPFIPHVSHLFFGDVLPFTFPGPITGIGPLLLNTASRWSCHVNIKCEIQTVSFYHVNAWEWLSINFHGELPQDQLALLNSRLNLLTELFVVIGGMGKYVMPLAMWSASQLLCYRKLMAFG
jgi:hypothetical protein